MTVCQESVLRLARFLDKKPTIETAGGHRFSDLASLKFLCYNSEKDKGERKVFREMRRKRQQMTESACMEIIEKNTSGVLGVLGDGGYPYAVPLSYVYDGGCLYFHCAKSGHKLDAIRNCDKVSFCIVDQDLVVPEEYTTYFRSVILFGKARILENEAEVRGAIEKLAVKYHPEDAKEHRDMMIEREYNAMCMVKIEIEHMTGKEAVELVARGRVSLR